MLQQQDTLWVVSLQIVFCSSNVRWFINNYGSYIKGFWLSSNHQKKSHYHQQQACFLSLMKSNLFLLVISWKSRIFCLLWNSCLTLTLRQQEEILQLHLKFLLKLSDKSYWVEYYQTTSLISALEEAYIKMWVRFLAVGILSGLLPWALQALRIVFIVLEMFLHLHSLVYKQTIEHSLLT